MPRFLIKLLTGLGHKPTSKGGAGHSVKFRRLLSDYAPSPQDVCGALATELKANAIIVERLPNGFVVVAGAPWKPTLQALDRVALNRCFRCRDLAGAGSKQSAGSDWLFVPVCRGGKVVCALGVTGLYCRRRFDLEHTPAIGLATKVLEASYEAPSGETRETDCVRS